MRTPQKIMDRIEERGKEDILGFEVEEYVDFLDFAHAEKYLASCTAVEWSEVYKEPTRENVIAKMQDYLEFAWEKADGAKGISANRSIMHYLAWIWLLDDDDFLRQIEDEYDNRYSDYGAPILEMIAAHYDLEK